MTTTSFAFDGAKSFDDNFEALLAELAGTDEEMATILRANASALMKVVRDGERDANARASFNAEIARALDAFAVTDSETGQS